MVLGIPWILYCGPVAWAASPTGPVQWRVTLAAKGI